MTSTLLQDLSGLEVVIDDEPEEASILRLARQHRLTFYDAAYLELAQRRGGELATLDRKLATAAKAEGIKVKGD